MILAYLSIKDLTRSLAVSKHWYATILGSLALRRILFLEPDHIRSEYLHVAWGTRECRATLIREARDEHSLTIVEAHPVLKIISDDPRRIVRSSVHTDRILCSSLQAVHPSTLLFQPPGETVYATLIPGQMGRGRKSYLRRFVVERTGGVTFGALLTEWRPSMMASCRGQMRIFATSISSRRWRPVRVRSRMLERHWRRHRGRNRLLVAPMSC
jgi:hypothetical protein